jgi:hypothetical protein
VPWQQSAEISSPLVAPFRSEVVQTEAAHDAGYIHMKIVRRMAGHGKMNSVIPVS